MQRFALLGAGAVIVGGAAYASMRNPSANDKASSAAEKLRSAGGDARDAASTLARDAKKDWQDVKSKAKSGFEETRNSAESAWSKTTEKAGKIRDEIKA